MATCFIAFGSNIGDSQTIVLNAAAELAALAGIDDLQLSSLYRTAPVGPVDQNDFINAVARCDTTLSPHALLTQLQSLELRYHRQRTIPQGPRTLDLDLLLYNDTCLSSDTLTLPHPAMTERLFVLAPLAELDANTIIPGHPPLTVLLAAVGDQTVTCINNIA